MHMNIRKSALLGAALLSPAMAALAKQRPNIIFFLVDDYGWPESSVAYGDEVYPRNRQFHTPNMERLAQQGVIFSHAYACPVSTPTRASLMSGMNALSGVTILGIGCAFWSLVFGVLVSFLAEPQDFKTQA